MKVHEAFRMVTRIEPETEPVPKDHPRTTPLTVKGLRSFGDQWAWCRMTVRLEAPNDIAVEVTAGKQHFRDREDYEKCEAMLREEAKKSLETILKHRGNRR